MYHVYLYTIQVRARTSAGYGPDSSPLDMSIGSGTVSKSSSEHVQVFFSYSILTLLQGESYKVYCYKLLTCSQLCGLAIFVYLDLQKGNNLALSPKSNVLVRWLNNPSHCVILACL